MHGQFVWYELHTSDVEGAKKFYPRFTGWGTQPFDNDYQMWTNAGVPIAGLYKLGADMQDQGVPPNWLMYVESNNVDETARLASSLGGKVVHGPADIPNVGRFAILQDPQGAMFGVYKSSGPSQSWDGTPSLGRFSWHELMTTDWQKANEFYRKLFGWEKTGEMDMGGGNMYFMFGKGRMFGGMFNRPKEMASMPPFWLLYIHVKDVPTAVDIATKAGAFVQRPPMEIPGGVIAIMGDPQGAGFAVHHASAPAATGDSTAGKPATKTARKATAQKTAKPAKTTAPAKTKAKKASAKARRAAAPTKKARKPVKKAARKAAKKSAARRRPAARKAKRSGGKKRR